jgi:subfamily B ATP-binding cassette protein HlyB/CyaB
MPPHAIAEGCADGAFAALALLARLQGLPAEAGTLARRHGPQATERDLLRAARGLGLKADLRDSAWERLPATPLPALARLRDGRWVVLARADAERVLVHDPAEPRPLTLPRAVLEPAWTGRLLLAARRAAVPEGSRRFDLRWFVPHIVRHRRLLGEVLLASLVIQLLALATPLFFQLVIDKVLVHQAYTTLHVLAVGMLAVIAFEAGLGGLRTWLYTHTASRIDVGLGVALFRHLLRLPQAYFDARRTGDTVARVRELETVRELLTGGALTLVVDAAFTVVFLAVMLLYSGTLTALVLATLPVYGLLALIVTPVLRRRLDERFARGAESHAFLVESVAGMGTVKAMAVEPAMQRRWEEQLAAYVGAGFRARTLGELAAQAAGFVSRLTTLLILWVGADLVIRGELSVGQLIAFNMLAGRVSGPILRLVQLWQDFQQAGIAVARLGDILNAPAEPEPRAAGAPPDAAGRIALEGVRFRYPGDGPEVLRGLDLQVAPGEVVGVVGASGSGKSTLARLLQRLYLPEAGRVRLDGLDVAHLDPAWLRRQVGVVLQESRLFNASVRDNIALTDPGAPLARVVDAARLADAHELILGLPGGYDTMLGEQGATLSGGQRQRIAIARTLLAAPSVLVLDEATSALDYESEARVLANLRRAARGRTVLIIAHRLGTVRQADRIVVLAEGRIVEAGGHEALLAAGGEYARLWRLQEGRGVPAAAAP